MLSTAAFNALLKTLEEPPEHVKFMFATTDPEKVLPTILSRCQRFDLRRIPAALIAKHLTHIAGLEKVKIDPAALYAIARGAEGAMRDAESALDQLISFCGDKIEEADVLSMFGLTAQGQLLELSRAVLAGEVESALRQLNDLANHGKDLGRLLSDLLNHFRNLLIFQVSRGDLKMLEVSEAEAAALAEQIQNGRRRRAHAHPGSPGRRGDAAARRGLEEDSGRSRLAQGHRGPQRREHRFAAQTTPGSCAKARPAKPPACPAPAAAARPQAGARGDRCGESQRRPRRASAAVPAAVPEQLAGATSLRDRRETWPSCGPGLLEAVGRASPFTRTYLLEAHPVSFTRTYSPSASTPNSRTTSAWWTTPATTPCCRPSCSNSATPTPSSSSSRPRRPQTARRARGTASPPAPASAPPKPPAPAKPAAAPAAPAKEKLAPVPFNKDDFKNDP